MIKLEVQDYCQRCPHFEPYVERPAIIYVNDEPSIVVGDTTIRCKHKDICEYVRRETKGKSTQI